MKLYLVRLSYDSSYHCDQDFKLFLTLESARFWAISRRKHLNQNWRIQIVTLEGVTFEDVKV